MKKMEEFIEEYKNDLKDIGLSELECLSCIISYMLEIISELETRRMHLIGEKLDSLYKE